jgi:hypothetical protein
MLNTIQRAAFHGHIGDLMTRARTVEVCGDAEVGALLQDVLRVLHLTVTGELPRAMDALAADTMPPLLSMAEARRILEEAGCLVIEPADEARDLFEAPAADHARSAVAA